MKRLAAFVANNSPLAWATAAMIVIGSGLAAGFLAGHLRAEERLGQLDTEAKRRGIEIMSQTLNGNMMGGLSLLGLIDPEVKREARGEIPPNGARMLGILETMGRSRQAQGAFLVGSDGLVKSAWDSIGKSATGLNVKFRPYFQMALQGKENVYAAVSLSRGERALYFSAPLYESGATGGRSIGAVVSRTGLERVDEVLTASADIALLLSPQEVIFASSRHEWVGFLASQPTPEKLKAIRDLKQFGNMFENKEPPILPFLPQPGIRRFDGHDYVVAESSVQWNDPSGDWKLVLMEDLGRTVPLLGRTWIGLGVGALVAAFLLLVMKVLRGHHTQLVASEKLIAYAHEQEAAAARKASLAIVSMHMQQTPGVDDLARLFLSEARELLGMLQGVVYVISGDTAGALRLAASYGCESPMSPTLLPGEGLLGQCAVERRVRVIDAPADGIWKIRSGLGDTPPAALILAPIQINDLLLGVAEIALLKAPDAAIQEQFAEMASLLAMNLEIRRQTLASTGSARAA